MAKEKAPVFKKIAQYQNIAANTNPFIVIGDLIEDHNWEYQMDRVTKDIIKVPTRNTYLMCKGCASCREIAKQGKLITDWKVAQIVTKPLEEWTKKEVLSLVSKRYTIRELAKVSGVKTAKAFISTVKPLFNEDKGIRSLLFYNIPYSIIKLFTGISQEEYETYKKEYDEEFEEAPLEFTEKVGI